MKKVIVPTVEELRKLREIVKNDRQIYQYIVTKIIELIILEGRAETEKKMLQVAYDEFSDYPEIAHSICGLYPEQIDKVEIAKYDIDLCCYLIRSINFPQDQTIKQLDDILPRFEDGCGVLTNKTVIEETIKQLAEKLSGYPQYRFEYKPNSLLDKIFSGDLSADMDFRFISSSIASSLMVIDPLYAIKLEQHMGMNLATETERAMFRYIDRYRISPNPGIEIYGQDVLGLPKTKQLTRYLENHRKK